MRVIIVSLAYSLVFGLIEFVTKKHSYDREVSRKIAHIIAGVSAAWLPLFLSFNEICLVSLLFVPIMLISKKINFFSSIHQVKRNTFGEVYFPIAILLSALLFRENLVFAYGLMVMAVSDGMASLIGQKYGKRKFTILNGTKSFAGSAAFLVCTLLISLAFGTASDLSFGLMVVFCMISTLVLTAVEAILSGGTDNLALPIAASSLLAIFIGL